MTRGITYQGPFFRGDPGRTFRRNVQTLMDGIARDAQGVARDLADGAEGDAIRDRIVGRTHALSGKRWQVTAVVSVNLAGLDRRQRARIMAIALGRRRAVTAGGRRIGTTQGVEGRLHVFQRATGRITLRADAGPILLRDIDA